MLVDDLEEKIKKKHEVKEERNFYFYTVTKLCVRLCSLGYSSRSPLFTILFLAAHDFAAGMEFFYTRRTRFIKVRVEFRKPLSFRSYGNF